MTGCVYSDTSEYTAEGATLPMRCPSCGAKCKAEWDTCPKCGTTLMPDVAVFGGAAREVREAWGLSPQAETSTPQSGHISRYFIFIIVALILILILLAGVLIMNYTAIPAQRAHGINSETFPDKAFMSVVSTFDTDGDGMLSAAEASEVTELDCSELGLTTLSGIELFTNLEILNASHNALTAVDLSDLNNLTDVDLSYNSLDTLDMANKTSLISLDVSHNIMLALDINGCSSLESLYCDGNSIARLDLSGCDALIDLTCDDGQNVTVPIAAGFFPDLGLRNALEEADPNGDGALSLRERQAIASLTITDPSTSSLQGISWLENLSELDVSGTNLITLDLSDIASSLTVLNASDCELATVIIGDAAHLISLDLSNNSNLIALDLSGAVRLTTLDVSGCNLGGTLDLRANTRMTFLDVSDNPSLETVDATGVEGLAEEGAVICDPGCTVILEEEIPEEPEEPEVVVPTEDGITEEKETLAAEAEAEAETEAETDEAA